MWYKITPISKHLESYKRNFVGKQSQPQLISMMLSMTTSGGSTPYPYTLFLKRGGSANLHFYPHDERFCSLLGQLSFDNSTCKRWLLFGTVKTYRLVAFVIMQSNPLFPFATLNLRSQQTFNTWIWLSRRLTEEPYPTAQSH